MVFWDYCVRADDEAAESAKMAKLLGWDGICMLADGEWKRSKKSEVDMAEGLLIDEKSANGVKKRVRAKRKDFGIIAVMGNNDEVNRATVETKEADILIPGEGTKIDVTMAKLAKENGVRIAFDFSTLLHSALEDRGRIFSQMKKNAMNVKRFHAPFVLTSGALSAFGLRSPSELTSLGKLLGFDEPNIKVSLNHGLIDENRKRLSGRWIMPGVEVEA